LCHHSFCVCFPPHFVFFQTRLIHRVHEFMA
jgi:hypothetical protein